MTSAELAAQLGVHPAYLSRVIHGHTKSGRIRDELARRFGAHFLRLLRPWGDTSPIDGSTVNPRGQR